MNFVRNVERISLVVNKIAIHATVVLFTVMTLIVWVQIFFRLYFGRRHCLVRGNSKNT